VHELSKSFHCGQQIQRKEPNPKSAQLPHRRSATSRLWQSPQPRVIQCWPPQQADLSKPAAILQPRNGRLHWPTIDQSKVEINHTQNRRFIQLEANCRQKVRAGTKSKAPSRRGRILENAKSKLHEQEEPSLRGEVVCSSQKARQHTYSNTLRPISNLAVRFVPAGRRNAGATRRHRSEHSQQYTGLQEDGAVERDM
jgi:hypothetical protein